MVLTLIAWGPNAIADWQNGPDALSHSTLRFLVIFTLARIAVRSVEGLVRSYMQAGRPGQSPIDVDDGESPSVSASRRRTDAS